ALAGMSVAAQSDVLSDSPPWHIPVPLTNIPARTTQGASLIPFFMGALQEPRLGGSLERSGAPRTKIENKGALRRSGG
ncbi:MAG TPA: hypothetical protein VD865_03455, partial [Stenotrophomonas sp.]|nr:hypothetical protein [Stenotrophomonas sp.]